MTAERGSIPVRIATLQPELTFGRPAENLALIRNSVEALVRAEPIDVLMLPEIFNGDRHWADPSEIDEFLITLARLGNVHIIGGSCRITDSTDRRTNTCFVVRRDGARVGRYDKRILFASEAGRHVPGSSAGVFELGSVCIGVLICADAWHPELCREFSGIVDVLFIAIKSGVPTDAHVAYARTLWRNLALIRAMENGYVVVTSDWSERMHEHNSIDGAGSQRYSHYTCGASAIVDPSHRPDMGRILRTLDAPGVLCADVDLQKLRAYRSYRQSVGLLPVAGTEPSSRAFKGSGSSSDCRW